jgi:uncharacterized protein
MKFFPKNKEFFKLFEKQGENFLKAAEILKDTMENFSHLKENAVKMKDLEHQADEIEHEVVDIMNKTFITPIDREDIYRLNHTLDDIIDLIENAFGASSIYQIEKLGPNTKKMMQLAVKTCYEINGVLGCLKNLKDQKAIIDHCIRIHSLENEADDLFKYALTDLINNKVEAMEFIKYSEVLRAFEDAMDKSEEVADILNGIVVKNL